MAIFLIVFGIPATSQVINRRLGNFVMRRIGLYSYSTYLWQQLATQVRPGWTVPDYLGALILSVLISWVSWNTIERFFRKRPTEFGARRYGAVA